MKKRGMFGWSILLVALVIMTGCGSKDKAAGGKESETFTVGMEAGYASFNWTQSDDANGGVKIDGTKEYAGGYDVAIAQKVADGLGKKLVIVKTEWDGLIPALTSGKIDAVMAGMSPTEERKKSIDFSDSYYKSNLVMVVKNGSKFQSATSIQDFEGAKVTGQLNTFHYSVIDQIKGVKKETAMDNFSAMRVALQSGVIDGYVSELPEGISAQSANSDFKLVEFKDGFKTSDEDTAIAVGLVQGSPLTAKINKILAEISPEEQAEIMEAAIKNQPAANLKD